jgi:putative endonuclease
MPHPPQIFCPRKKHNRAKQMSTSRKSTGDAGERIAVEFLINRGYTILGNNYHCQYGEVDIIAKHKGCLVFVEVRTKKSLAFGTPEESITQAKKAKLILTSQTYMQEHDDLPDNWRIDVVAIEMNKAGGVLRIEQIKSAIA